MSRQFNNLDFLRWKMKKGWKEKNIPETKEYFDRAKFELEVVSKMGFVDYFLIIADILDFCRDNNIPVGPGRGSACGSLIAYAVGITTIDPIKYGLYFERFLNPSRISMPDVDMDISKDRRDEVITHLQEKYGNDRVANIITFGKMWSRAIIRNIAMALQIPDHAKVADRIAKKFPASADIDFEDAIADSPELQEEAKKYPEIFNIARDLAGKSKSTGVHASGIVITPKPITDYMPLFKSPKTDKFSSITQWDMYDMEDGGFLKVDVLGLNTLDIMKRVMDRIYERRGIKINAEVDIKMDDKRTLALFARGETTGVFQLERKYVQNMCKSMKVNCFEDVFALTALIRPGTLHAGVTELYIKRKKGESPIEYLHPSLEHSMKETLNTVLYQETAMQIAKDYAGFNMTEADNLRKAIGKKIPEKMAEAKTLFYEKSKSLGRPDSVTEEIFSQIETAQKYSFNKSHSVAYGKIAFQAAWFKAHFPTEFMCELINGEDEKEKIGTYINEIKTLGVKLIPPSALTSGAYFEIRDDETVEFGLSFIKNVTPPTVKELIKNREYLKSFTEFLYNSDMGVLSADVMRNMINVGVFDFMGEHRDILLAKYEFVKEKIVKYKDQQKRKASGVKLRVEYSISEIAQEERDFEYSGEKRTLEEMLGEEFVLCNYYVTADPTEPFKKIIEEETNTDILDMIDGFFPSDSDLKIVAMVSEIKLHSISKLNSKNDGRTMAFLDIYDKRQNMDAILFPDVYDALKNNLNNNKIYLFTGRYKDGTFLIKDMKMLSSI
ncbi:MAG: DNA polymerase III subunit alpha [Melioribacteraceae bacterium]|nr:DNA polymerase III subunit alpha [Melioribacteraceae bacterium]